MIVMATGQNVFVFFYYVFIAIEVSVEAHLVRYTITHNPVFRDMGLLLCNKLSNTNYIINKICTQFGEKMFSYMLINQITGQQSKNQHCEQRK